jgi:hypothetical protein
MCKVTVEGEWRQPYGLPGDAAAQASAVYWIRRAVALPGSRMDDVTVTVPETAQSAVRRS